MTAPEMSSPASRSSRRGFLKAAGLAAAGVGAAGVGLPRPARAATKPKQLPFALALASYTTRKLTLEETLRIAQRLALEHICLKSFHLPLEATPEVIRQVAEKVRAAGIDLYGGGVIRMADKAEVDRAFDYAKAAGMRVIVGVPYEEVLPLVNQKVKQYDIRVAIHNHGPGDKHYATPEDAYRKIEKLDPRLGLCMDIGHTVRAGADPAADAVRFADRLLDIHMKDVSAAAKDGKTLEIGRGVIDIPGFLRALVETNYSGMVSFEYEKDPDDPLCGLAESVGYVRGVLAAI